MISSLTNHVYRFLYWATAAATAVFFVLILLNVVARFILKSPILGSVELSRLFFVWASFLGAAICYYRHAHISISFLADRFTGKTRLGLALFIYLLSLGFFLVVGLASLQLVELLWHTSLPITKISQSWLYVPVPVSMVFMALFTLQFIQRDYLLIRQ